jgi:hypothetical protein
MIKEEEQA